MLTKDTNRSISDRQQGASVPNSEPVLYLGEEKKLHKSHWDSCFKVIKLIKTDVLYPLETDSRGKRRILKCKFKFFSSVKLEKGNYFRKGNYKVERTQS